jgi:Site-specific DNA methylase
LVGHDKGRTLKVIIQTLKDLGYDVHYTVLNALDYGLPQKRERVVIVGHKQPIFFSFPSPIRPFKPLSDILEKKWTKNTLPLITLQTKGKKSINQLTNYQFGTKIKQVIYAHIHILVL